MMFRIIMMICGLLIVSCGSEDSTEYVQDDSEDWFDDDFDTDFEDYAYGEDPELGHMTIAVAEDNFDDAAFCALYIIRSPAQELASVNMTFNLAADPEKLFGPGYDQDNLSSGDFNLSGAYYSSTGYSISTLFYMPPHIRVDDEEEGWLFDFLDPRGSVSLLVDGQAFDAVSSDDRDADNLAEAPHLWQVSMQVEAGLLGPANGGDNERAEGSFQFEGPCTVNVTYVD